MFFSLSRNCREEGCGKPYLKVKPVPVGGGLQVHTNCAAGHKLKWESCNFYNQVLLRKFSPSLFLSPPTSFSSVFFAEFMLGGTNIMRCFIHKKVYMRHIYLHSISRGNSSHLGCVLCIFERCCNRTQRDAVASRRATNLATHLPTIPYN